MSDIYQLCLESSYCEDLKAALSVSDVATRYGGDDFDLDQQRLKKTPIRLHGNPPDLLGESARTGPGQDAWNAIQLHRWMPEMTAVQAVDPRVWAYLTHSLYFQYSKKRWGIEGGKDPAKHIKNRWFLRGGRQGLLSNSIARLWWAAELTFAPWVRDRVYFAPLVDKYSDDYIFTRRLFSHQNMFQGLVARHFGGSLRIRICMLEAFERHAAKHSNLSALSEMVELKLNLICSYRVLSALPFRTLVVVMETQLQRAMEELQQRGTATKS